MAQKQGSYVYTFSTHNMKPIISVLLGFLFPHLAAKYVHFGDKTSLFQSAIIWKPRG